MRFNDKDMVSHAGVNQLFNVDFHDFIQQEQSAGVIELASEFGLSIREVKNLKKQLHRS